MGAIRDWLEKSEKKWLWFWLTLIGSVLPIFFRFFASYLWKIESFDFKDLLFAGLAMTLINFNTLGKSYAGKTGILVLSAFLIAGFSFLITIFLYADGSHVENIGLFKGLSFATTVAAVLLSYETKDFF